jgi:hypothetical protein
MLEKAAALYPDEDLTEHAALFVARCRGKGYQVRVEQADDFWLSWLIEDARKARRRGGKGRAERSMARSGKIEAGNHFTDFLAGAAGAGAHGGMLKGTRSDRDRTAAYNRFEAWGIAAS